VYLRITFQKILQDNFARWFKDLQNNVAINLDKNLTILYFAYHVAAIFFISEKFGDGMKSILAE